MYKILFKSNLTLTMDASTAKVLSMLALGLGSFFSGMLPAFISEAARQRHPLTISCLLCFGAGVLLSTSLVHMLPEAREKLPNDTELMFCIGFLIVYLVDEIVHLFYTNNGQVAVRTYGSAEETTLLRHGEHGQSRQEEHGVHVGEAEMKDRCCGDAGNPRMCHVSHTEPCNKSASALVGLLGALFVHSLLEGLAIGLQETTSQVKYTY